MLLVAAGRTLINPRDKPSQRYCIVLIRRCDVRRSSVAGLEQIRLTQCVPRS
jgi:hypothetical protein